MNRLATIIPKPQAMFAFLLPLGLYWATLPSGLTWAYHGTDGGDLMTAAYTLGIPHPHGYPTYVLAGWAFSHLAGGDIAWRFNLFSAVCMAGAAWGLFIIGRTVTQSPLASLVAAWSFALTPLVWSQAIITEVYALNICLIVIWLIVGLRGWPIFLGIIYGLLLGSHLTSLFLLPVFIAFILNNPASGSSLTHSPRRSFLLAGGGLLLGLSIFLYLPLRSGQGAITWGAPHTWAGFWGLVSGQIYQGYLFSLPLNQVLSRLLALLNYLTQAGVLVVGLAGLGLYHLSQQQQKAWGWGVVSCLAYLVYALSYNTADSYIYLLPLLMAQSLLAGLGFATVITISLQKIEVTILTGLFLAHVGWSIWGGWGLGLQKNNQANIFWQTVLAQAPRQAVILTTSEEKTFALWYAHYVLGQRPDVAVVDTNLVAYPWHRANLKDQQPDLHNLTQLATIFKQNKGYHRPLCYIWQNTRYQIGWNIWVDPQPLPNSLQSNRTEAFTHQPWLLECHLPTG